jgi:membrane protein YdbS with pleckstrin-like domain
MKPLLKKINNMVAMLSTLCMALCIVVLIMYGMFGFMQGLWECIMSIPILRVILIILIIFMTSMGIMIFSQKKKI